MLCGLAFLTTGAAWRGCQLQLVVDMTVQSVMSGRKPHQNNLLLPEQQVIVIPLRSWHRERSEEDIPFAEVDIVDILFSSGTLLCKDARLLIF